MNKDILSLIKKQEAVSEKWCDRLKGVKQKQFSFTTTNGNTLHYTLQCNTERIRSTMAKTGAATAPKVCPLCAENRPSDQLSLDWKAVKSGNEFEILVNPYPIFPAHLTIASKHHTPQTMNAWDMQELARYTGLAVFFNGADCGASIPGHMHYQAAPVEYFNFIKDSLECDTQVLTFHSEWLLNSGRKAIGMLTSSLHDANEEMDNIMKELNRENDRMINALTYYDKEEKLFHWLIFPRQTFRPDCFFAENEDERRLISPATAEMCGVIVTPDINTFNNTTLEEILRIILDS